MKNILITSAIVALFASCQSSTSNSGNSPAGVHTAVVQEVLQANQYTYLHVKDGDKDPWLAVAKMEAKVGDTYYYKDGLQMNDFNSKELNRTFKEILFVDNVSTTPNLPDKKAAAPVAPANEMASMNPNMAPTTMIATDHTVKALEVLQTTQYTYIRAKEGEKELWLAATKMEASVGKTYYFRGGLPMSNFASKELKRTFDVVLFLDNISDNPPNSSQTAASAPPQNNVTKGSTVDTEKKKVDVKHSKDDVTIAKLFENKKTYTGKTVKIKGQVTKYNAGIMKKNWIHLQDGTDFSGKFDLAITTDQEVKVGDMVTVEGIISLDKDFGFGYFYDVIMENATVSK